MADATIRVAGRTWPLHQRRSRRARHLLLHVSAHRGVELVVPWRVSVAEATQFFQDKQPWIARTLARIGRELPLMTKHYATGTRLPYRGQVLHLAVQSRRTSPAAELQDTTLRVAGDSPAAVRRTIARWYRAQAQQYFTHTAAELCGVLPCPVAPVTIRDTRTQWGSCTAAGRLTFSWRLLLAPEAVARYVAAHEVAHLVHRHHGPAFWALVHRLDPHVPAARQWLKQWGETLLLF